MKLNRVNINIIFLTFTSIFCGALGKSTNGDPSYLFDTDLYESVLDTKLCQRQMQYIVQSNDTILRLQFLDAGLRIPSGVSNGNLMDLGNYPECLSVKKDLEDMTIQGKYCTVRVRINITNFMSVSNTMDELNLDEHTLQILQNFNREKSILLEKIILDPVTTIHNREAIPGGLDLTLAICVPRPCTTRDVLDGLPGLNTLPYEDVYCRLPNDKPLAAVDYIAWVVVILLVISTTLSTCYDVNHTIVHKRDPKKLSKILNAFSIYRNTQNLIKITSRSGTLECLDGIRALSMFWVIVGHTFAMGSIFPVINGIEILRWYHSFSAFWVKAATLSVDTFFLLSGLLLVYTTSHKITTVQLAKNLHLFYLNRLLRVFPVLAVVVLMQASFFHHIGDGPRWHTAADMVERCRSHWWATLLHVQNFLYKQRRCIIVSWYLPIDVQLHILSPLVLFWVLSGAKRAAWFGLISGISLSLIGSAVYVFVANWTDYRSEVYINILCRAPPFFVGMIYGYLLNLWRGKRFVMNDILGYFATFFSIGILALSIYIEHVRESTEVETSETLHNTITSFGRTLWAVAVGWIIFACVNGYSGPINWFLSLSVWKIPSRISYATYLIHMSIMNAYYGSALQPKWFSIELSNLYLSVENTSIRNLLPCGLVKFIYSFHALILLLLLCCTANWNSVLLFIQMFDFFAFLLLTLFVSFFITVLVETPFAILFKLLLEPRREIVKAEKESNKTELNNSTRNSKMV